MTRFFRHPAKVGLLLVLLLGLLGNGRCQMAMEIWAGLQEQLDSQQDQLNFQEDQICELYGASDLPSPPQCIRAPDPPPGQNVCNPSKTPTPGCP